MGARRCVVRCAMWSCVVCGKVVCVVMCGVWHVVWCALCSGGVWCVLQMMMGAVSGGGRV